MSMSRAPALLTLLILSLVIPQCLPCLCSILKNFKVMHSLAGGACLNYSHSICPSVPDLH